MSYHPYRLQSINDERRLLETMLNLEDKVRMTRENERRLKSAESSRYAKMFQPVTNSLRKLQPSKPLVKVETSTSTDESLQNNPDEAGSHEPDEKVDIDEPGQLYKDALNSIPPLSRDDGIFGLNVTSKDIGGYHFSVKGDVLHILDSENNEIKVYVINDFHLWQLLLVKRPRDIGLKLKGPLGRNTSTLDQFIKIVQDLDLVQIALTKGYNIKNRAKYKLLPKVGHGFLFTSTEPEFLRKTLVNPNVVVVPSDKKGLLRELVKSVAELRSGNTSMQNVVVPLAQEAKRLKILPPGLLSPKEMSWVFV